jgi:hypothetical protein
VRLYTSRWSNRDLARLDVVPVGVSRGTPRFPVGYRYRRLMELAPDPWMLGIESDERFEEVYVKKLERLGVDRIMEGLTKISVEEGGKDLCLLCFEDLTKPGEVCHRRMFADWWTERTGKDVPELTSCGPSHKRQDLQSPLF